MHRAHTVSVAIAVDPGEVYAYACEPANMPHWAPGFAKSVEQRGGQWIAHTTLGEVRVRFAARNTLGVLDHEIETDTRVFHNAMRVIPNGRGSEVLFTALQFEGVTDEQFAADLNTVRADLNKLRTLLEPRPTDPA